MAEQSMIERVGSAIETKQQVVCDYGGYRRELCPHAIGWKHGREQVIAFQFGGLSPKGLPPGGEWRCFAVSGISAVTIQDGKWHTGHSHLRPQTCVDMVDVEVPY